MRLVVRKMIIWIDLRIAENNLNGDVITVINRNQ